MNTVQAVATLTGAFGSVTVIRQDADTFQVVAGDVDDPDRHEVLTVDREALRTFAEELLAHLANRPSSRVSVPWDAPFPVSVSLASGGTVLNVLDDGDDLAVLVPVVKRGATRLSAGSVETFARRLTEVLR